MPQRHANESLSILRTTRQGVDILHLHGQERRSRRNRKRYLSGQIIDQASCRRDQQLRTEIRDWPIHSNSRCLVFAMSLKDVGRASI